MTTIYCLFKAGVEHYFTANILVFEVQTINCQPLCVPCNKCPKILFQVRKKYVKKCGGFKGMLNFYKR